MAETRTAAKTEPEKKQEGCKYCGRGRLIVHEVYYTGMSNPHVDDCDTHYCFYCGRKLPDYPDEES